MDAREHADAEDGFRQPRRILGLTLGLVAGPLLALLSLHANYPLVSWSCRHGNPLPLHLVALLMLLLAAGGVWLAWRDWRLAGRAWPGEEGGAVGRSRFMATLGVLLCAFFALLIVVMWVPTLVFTPCQGS